MPINNNLDPVKLHMERKWGKKPETRFKNNLEAIRVKLISYPTLEELRKFIPGFVNATWDEPDTEYTEEQITEAIEDMFRGRTLPQVLETINLVFSIRGISLQEVTHILRHRNATFSADCSGDKWWTDRAALVPSSVESVPELYEKYQRVVEECKELYQEIADTDGISILDARYILPRCIETYYYMRMNLGDTIRFIKQRMDRQIQPETDNAIAYLMLLELCEVYPIMSHIIDIDEPCGVYISTARNGKGSNLYYPEENNDVFEYNEDDFVYKCKRDEMRGSECFKYFYGRVKERLDNFKLMSGYKK